MFDACGFWLIVLLWILLLVVGWWCVCDLRFHCVAGLDCRVGGLILVAVVAFVDL